MTSKTDPVAIEVQEILRQLSENGLSCETILQRSGNRISRATFFRWKGGYSTPGQKNHVRYFRDLLARVNREKAIAPQ